MQVPTGRELREKRTALGLRQAEVAELAGISQSMVARIEAGTVDPRASTLRKFVEVLQKAERSTVTAADIMHTPVISVSPAEPIAKSVQIMEDNDISQIPVLQDGVPVGCISESAIINAMEDKRLHKSQILPVSEFMEEGFPTVPPSNDIDPIVHMLHRYHAVLVVEKGKVIGVITKHDMISLIA